jgi:hypothetical protein
MIKIFGDEEDQPKNSGTKAAAPFSLNLDPVDETRPEPPPVEAPPVEAPPPEPEPIPEETPIIRAEEPAPIAASPWEKIEETPRFSAREAFENPITFREAAKNEPEAPARAAEPPIFIEDAPPEPEVFVKVPYQPDTSDETIHNSGLAWSAGIIFFGSVVFMMLLGWGFDLLFGSSPYGLVGGIVFGSLIGFIQFFRISSQIFRK